MTVKTLYLVSCVGQKRNAAAPARELYTSPWFRGVRRYVEARDAAWCILSAEHGLVYPRQVLAPYEKTLNKMPISERRAWAAGVRTRLASTLSFFDRVVVFAGARYREFLIDYLRENIEVEVPLEGLGIGEQLGWLKRANA